MSWNASASIARNAAQHHRAMNLHRVRHYPDWRGGDITRSLNDIWLREGCLVAVWGEGGKCTRGFAGAGAYGGGGDASRAAQLEDIQNVAAASSGVCVWYNLHLLASLQMGLSSCEGWAGVVLVAGMLSSGGQARQRGS
eukprot:2502687-Alexandrium_andersonii.AAC.1